VIINIIVTLVVVFVAISVFNSRNEGPSTSQVVITVPVLITSTRDPNATESVRIITATPLPGTPGTVLLPTDLLDDIGGTIASAPTIDPSLIAGSSGLQQTATSLPANCVLHTVAEGDTPFGIAEQYGSDGFRLMEVNGLTDETASLMQIGDVLIVPLEGCTLSAPTSSSTEESNADASGTQEVSGTAGAAGATTAPPTVSPTPAPTSTATLPPTATNAQVEIVRVISPGDINAEGVDVRNNGAVVDLTGWTLSTADGIKYTFPQQRLFTGSVLTVYTRVGSDTPTAKFWGRDTALWSRGATLTLSDANGAAQSTYIVP
jgi:LysM repeat protein